MPTYPYTSGQGAIAQTFTQLRKGFPAKVDAGYLQRFGIAPANESYIIAILRSLELIDEEGSRKDENTESSSAVTTFSSQGSRKGCARRTPNCSMRWAMTQPAAEVVVKLSLDPQGINGWCGVLVHGTRSSRTARGRRRRRLQSLPRVTLRCCYERERRSRRGGNDPVHRDPEVPRTDPLLA